jgi:gamma-glutamyltranspeptidase / glutathione hydrolase
LRARIRAAVNAPLFPHAAIATPHYLASSAGLAVLTSGGNAVDAAVAANVVLAVVYPHMCGLGGDLFAMVWVDGELAGLNSSGRLPAEAKLDGDRVPRTGVGSAVVPGAAAGWLALLERHGTRSMGELARPAIRLAREGCPRSPGLVRITSLMSGLLERDEEARRIFLAEGPLIQEDLASTLGDLDLFYMGPVGNRAPAPFSPADFAEHRAEWVEPMRTEWRELEVCEMPPNSRGHLALRMLEALEPLDGLTPNDADWHRRLVRAHHSVVSASEDGGDTIYLCVRDERGMAVSLSQSLSGAFGSGVVVPGTGVLLHNRAEYFKPEEYRGGARPVHTLSPAMALKDGAPHLIFGSMGGLSQLQVHLQLLCRIVIAGQGIADAVAAPRWRIFPKMLCAEEGLPDLGAQPYPYPDLAGHAHVIRVLSGAVEAAFDPRSDGAALGY